VRIGLLADIHANREAFEAALAKLARYGVDQYALLGDLIGYGPDPVWCVERAARLFETGGIGILGNHDAAIEGSDDDMNRVAREAIAWTRDQLDASHRSVIRSLLVSHREKDALFVHASACHPTDWAYVTDAPRAEQSLRATDARVTLVGHVHQARLWRLTPSGPATGHAPFNDLEIPLAASQRWLAVLGSVGQSRDGKPGAAFGVLDLAKRSLLFGRVDYDHYTAARKVREAGLPASLSERLLRGL
jgi:diadenosine tetraphosphatase ApaH/serine/threonine PP2A family protein phosphatase